MHDKLTSPTRLNYQVSILFSNCTSVFHILLHFIVIQPKDKIVTKKYNNESENI